MFLKLKRLSPCYLLVSLDLGFLKCIMNTVLFTTASVYLGDDALPNGLDITFEVKELRRLTGSYNTMVGNNEGSMVRHFINCVIFVFVIETSLPQKKCYFFF